MNTSLEFNVTAATFVQDVIERSKQVPVLVDFWADWCAPCKQLMPILERLNVEYAGRFLLAKVNADEQQELAQQIGVQSLPTVVIFKDAQVAEHFVGIVPESQIRELLERHVAPAIAAPISPLLHARQLKQAHEYAAAKEVVQQALSQEANDIDLLCEAAEIDLLTGNLDGAKTQLTALQAREPKASGVKRVAAMIEFNDVIAAHPDLATLKTKLSANPEDMEARHALAVHRLLAGDYDAALQDLMELLRMNRKSPDHVVRKSLLMAFDMIGTNEPLVAQTRREMAQLLF